MLLVLEAGEQAGCPDALGALFMLRLPDGVTVNVTEAPATGTPYGSVTCKYEKAPKSVRACLRELCIPARSSV